MSGIVVSSLSSKSVEYSKSSKNVIILLTCIISFNSPNSPVRLVLFSPILQIRKQRDRLVK